MYWVGRAGGRAGGLVEDDGGVGDGGEEEGETWVARSVYRRMFLCLCRGH